MKKENQKRKSEFVVQATWILKTDYDKVSFISGNMIPTKLKLFKKK